jgi:hypothetical protein
MASVQEKVQAVVWFAESKSIISVQRRFRREFQKDPSDPKYIRQWFATFLATGSVQKRHGGGRRVSEVRVEEVTVAFTHSPWKSTRRASRELQMPRTTLQRVLHKRLRLYAYKVQIVQEIKPADKPQRQNFAIYILERIKQNQDFLSLVMFSNEATFHLSGKVNQHNVRIWGSENPHVVHKHI